MPDQQMGSPAGVRQRAGQSETPAPDLEEPKGGTSAICLSERTSARVWAVRQLPWMRLPSCGQERFDESGPGSATVPAGDSSQGDEDSSLKVTFVNLTILPRSYSGERHRVRIDDGSPVRGQLRGAPRVRAGHRERSQCPHSDVRGVSGGTSAVG
jgi:hypothetical protein